MNNEIQGIGSIERLRPENLKGLADKELFILEQAGYSNVKEIQEKVLASIISASAETEFGKIYGFGSIHSADEFRLKVPVTEWSDYEPYVEKMELGVSDVLFPGKPEQFIISSGTTANKPKLIPESKAGAAAKSIVTRLRLIHIGLKFPGIERSGSIFPLANPSALSKTEGGIPCGHASGFTLNHSLSDGLITSIAFPLDVLSAGNAQSRDYLMMLFSIAKGDVSIIAGNNAGRFSELASLASNRAGDIIRDIRQGTIDGSGIQDPEIKRRISAFLVPDPDRADELQSMIDQRGTFLPGDYWPSLRLVLFWLSSSVGQYIKDIKHLLPATTHFFDIGYGASEGKFNIPDKPDLAAGPLSLYTAFYEFIPEKGGTPLMAHELTDRQSYELIITTWSGLYRYNLKDMVKVDGFTGQTPNIVFQSKSGELLNNTGERLPASFVSEIIRNVAAGMGTDVLQVQIFPDEELRRYLCYVESTAETSGFNADIIAEKVHQELGEKHYLYYLLCVQQKLMNPLLIIEMKQGWQNHLYEIKTREGISSTQVKLPVMIRQKADQEWIKN